MIYIHCATAVFLLLSAFVMTTRNMISAIYFKVIPFFLGAGEAIYCLKHFGVI